MIYILWPESNSKPVSLVAQDTKCFSPMQHFPCFSTHCFQSPIFHHSTPCPVVCLTVTKKPGGQHQELAFTPPVPCDTRVSLHTFPLCDTNQSEKLLCSPLTEHHTSSKASLWLTGCRWTSVIQLVHLGSQVLAQDGNIC